MNKIRKYLSFYSKSLKSQFIYRTNTISSFLSSLLSFIIQVSLWSALIQSNVKKGTSLQDMMIYVMLNTLVLTMTKANIATTIEPAVRDGSIIQYFLYPMSFKIYCYSTVLGENTYRVITTALPTVVIGALLFGTSFPASPWYFVCFLLALMIGVLIMLELTYFFGLLTFFVQKAWYLDWYLRAGMTFLGGSVVPLWFYPHILDRLSYFLPFRYVSFTAIDFYLQKTPIDQASGILLGGGVWWLILIGCSQLLWKRVQKQLMVNGG